MIKILSTLGPGSLNKETVQTLAQKGVNLFRINLSHTALDDVASNLLMGASGLVLAAETAIGQYPVESVEMIAAIIKQFEQWSPNTSFQNLIES